MKYSTTVQKNQTVVNKDLKTKIKWDSVFFKIHKIQDVKQKWFQIRLVHRILATNYSLKKMHKTTSEMCSFCNIATESLEHLYWECGLVRQFWKDLERLINQKCSHASHFKFTQLLIMFGRDDNIKTDEVLDFVILLAKMHLYFCKRHNKSLRTENFIQYLTERYAIEKYNASIALNRNTFDARWAHYQDLMNI